MKTPGQQAEYHQQHPPGFLHEFVVRPAFVTDVKFDGHGSTGVYPDELVENLNVLFDIGCTCGGSTHTIIAEAVDTEISLYDGLVVAERYHLKCARCGRQSLLFDVSKYGYDAEVDRMAGLADFDNDDAGELDSASETAECQCTNCANPILEVVTRLEYSSDLFERPEFSGKEQDFFSWITIVGKCPQCSTLTTLADFECS